MHQLEKPVESACISSLTMLSRCSFIAFSSFLLHGFKGSPCIAERCRCGYTRSMLATCIEKLSFCNYMTKQILRDSIRSDVHSPFLRKKSAKLLKNDRFGGSGSCSAVSDTLSDVLSCAVSCLWISPACNACC